MLLKDEDAVGPHRTVETLCFAKLLISSVKKDGLDAIGLQDGAQERT